MKLPLQLTFRNIEASEAMENTIREKAAKLDQFHSHIMSCRVIVEAHHKHHLKGNLFHVRIDITLPDREIVVSKDPGKDRSHEDAYVAIRDAFDAARRQLEELSRRQQQHVKTHEPPPHGKISKLNIEGNYGTIMTADGREIYFHRNSVLNADFEQLDIGNEVRFDEESGDDGPQASTVKLIGKHHIHN